MNRTAGEVIREFWRLMSSNDFYSVTVMLAPDFVLEWPQSNECIRGGEHFAQMNAEYPAHGRWQFTLNRILVEEGEVVTEVAITDGVQTATAISFFTVAEGRITRLVEYWPEPYSAPEGRAHLVEAILH
ncbi:nuclear transport factor 2 family protein [Halomonas sp. LR3S48]|uniref:nuclear transport factor 2 family protein n=1 Tax=Halomonadaceae TaxID=28256 RepID=UPI0021E3E561|nr:nuclear transport factor 2 family protein [Halomonas sp. LR3S48]UYG04414.1 nuclear transport factor 2 family protein [Halomonas sp. LR3S48]